MSKKRGLWEPVEMEDCFKVPLSRGEYALIDKDDIDLVKKFNWNCWVSPKTEGLKYAFSSVKEKHRMHRIITNCPKGMDVDHINGNGLDNRKINLRICDRRHNNYNMGLTKSNKSGYKGVHWDKKRSKWVTTINIYGKSTYLGAFDTPKEAGKAYIDKASTFQGDFLCQRLM